MNGFRAIVVNVVRASFRNRVALLFTLGLAFFFMLIFGLIFNGTGVSLTIGVVDQDHTTLSQQYVDALSNTHGLKVENGSAAAEQERLRKDSIVYLVVVEPGFSRAATGTSAQVTTYQSVAATQNASIAANVVNAVTTQFALRSHLGGPPGIILSAAQNVSTNDIRAIDFILPAMVAYLVLQSGINFVAIGLVDQRQRKVLRRFLGTPVRPVQVLGANIVGGAVTVLLQVAVLIIAGMALFGARTHGSWLLAGALIIVGTATFVSIGFLLCSVARTSESARGLATMVAFPMLFLSGVFIPLDALPQLLQSLVHALPLTYLTEGLHAVLNDGDGLTSTVGIDLAVMTTWAAVCFALAAWRFRWE